VLCTPCKYYVTGSQLCLSVQYFVSVNIVRHWFGIRFVLNFINQLIISVTANPAACIFIDRRQAAIFSYEVICRGLHESDM
jgi:hypothetical protein